MTHDQSTAMIAICIGHSRPGDTGAESVAGISEHVFNSRIGAKLASILTARGMACTVISTYQGNSYGAAIKWLASHLATLQATVAIELHFNASANPQATGHEWLYWNASSPGRELAMQMERQMYRAFPTLRGRGLKALFAKDRGAEFLRATSCPAVICEPFFGTNESDWQLIRNHENRYAQVLADALLGWKGGA
jgi:N-acetylmuramoyl-L-alanine amidase